MLKTKKVYMTKKRRAKIMVRKATAIILAITIAWAVIIHAGQWSEMDTAFAEGIIKIEPRQEIKAQTPEEKILEIARANNFRWPDYLVRLAYCESRFDVYAVGDQGKSRGLFQIHKGYHPEVSNECAFNIKCATEWTIKMINDGKQSAWSCDKIIKNNVAKN